MPLSSLTKGVRLIFQSASLNFAKYETLTIIQKAYANDYFDQSCIVGMFNISPQKTSPYRTKVVSNYMDKILLQA